MGFSDDLDDYLSATRQRLIHSPSDDISNTNSYDNHTTESTLPDHERYLYNSDRDIWYDTVTDTYSKYDAQRHCYIPVSFSSSRYNDAQQQLNDDDDDDPANNNNNDEPDSDASCRLVVIESTVVPVGQVTVMDANGATIGRDKKEWDTRRMRLRDMQVSKYHCQLFYDQDKHAFAITDVGSQNGTLLNGERLSPAKTSSRPFELKNGDELTLGTTVLQVHLHDHGWPCQQCQTSATSTTTISAVAAAEPTSHGSSEGQEQKQQRLTKPATTKKQWQKQLLQKYDDDTSNTTDQQRHQQQSRQQRQYIDRAQLRRERDPAEVDNEHYHQRRTTAINNEPDAVDLETPVQGKGYDMLRKMGWQSGQGMGMNQQGIVEPLAPKSTPNERAGLGAQNLSKKDRQYQQMKQRYGQS
ncbi:hypothetical protein BCR42DRAFT_411857 [Absidia repens]|uniref:SMAD/FHA domain-containing protein n=1 Tax=Absidia repens TaxID=90262 RepID=A0A1X2INS9_9FUNG|nr:hypothetical protein BCR42DRAFT_411857 [Absidia repens]